MDVSKLFNLLATAPEEKRDARFVMQVNFILDLLPQTQHTPPEVWWEQMTVLDTEDYHTLPPGSPAANLKNKWIAFFADSWKLPEPRVKITARLIHACSDPLTPVRFKWNRPRPPVSQSGQPLCSVFPSLSLSPIRSLEHSDNRARVMSHSSLPCSSPFYRNLCAYSSQSLSSRSLFRFPRHVTLRHVSLCHVSLSHVPLRHVLCLSRFAPPPSESPLFFPADLDQVLTQRAPPSLVTPLPAQDTPLPAQDTPLMLDKNSRHEPSAAKDRPPEVSSGQSGHPPEVYAVPGRPPEVYAVPGRPPEVYVVPGRPPEVYVVPGRPPEVYSGQSGHPPEVYAVPGRPPEVYSGQSGHPPEVSSGQSGRPPEVYAIPGRPPEVYSSQSGRPSEISSGNTGRPPELSPVPVCHSNSCFGFERPVSVLKGGHM